MPRLVLLVVFAVSFTLVSRSEPPAPNEKRSESPEAIDRLIRQLGADSFEQREQASRALKEVGERALPALRRAERSKDAEVRRRAERLIAAIEAGIYCQVLCLRGHRSPVWCVAFSPDGRSALSGGGWFPRRGRPPDDSARLWDLGTGKEKRAFRGHDGAVRTVAFSPSGRRALSVGGKAAAVWDVATGKVRDRFPIKEASYPSGVAYDAISARYFLWFSAQFLGERRLVLGTEVWDVGSARKLYDLEGSSSASLTVSQDGRHALRGNLTYYGTCRISENYFRRLGALQLEDPRSGKVLVRFEGHTGLVAAVAFCPDGRHVLSSSYDGTVRLWERKTGRQVRCVKIATACLAFSPDGRRGLSVAPDGDIVLWDIESGKSLRRYTGHKGAVHSLAFSPDGLRALSGGEDGTVRLWRLPK